MYLVYFFILMLFSLSAKSFPENVRHGYFSCTACHISSSGGGILTAYGRSLSAELMSTWGSPSHAGFLFSDNELEPTIPWLRSQVFIKVVQTLIDTPEMEKAQFIPMQLDAEFGYDSNEWAIILTLGYRSNSTSKELREFFSRRHYLLYRMNENLDFRLGKFMASFGLNGADHVISTRRGLGWDQGSETNNFEINYIDEKMIHTLTFISDTPRDSISDKDSAISINSAYFLLDKSKVGLSIYYGKQNSFDRIIWGPYLTYPLTEKLYFNLEYFTQSKTFRETSLKQNGYVTFSRLGYQFHKGLTGFMQFDRSYLDRSDENTLTDSNGIGLQWLPYPHFDFILFIGREKQFVQESPTQISWMMINIYL